MKPRTIGSLEDLLIEYRISYHATGSRTRPGWLNLRCPRCGKDPYLGYNKSRGYFTCWNCGYIPALEVIRCLTGLSTAECLELWKQVPRTLLAPRFRLRGTLKRPEGITELLSCHRDYLAGRGFDPDQISSVWGVKGLGLLAGRLKWRLYIPVHQGGEEVSWTTRTIGNVEPRYYSATDEQSAIPISELLYGLDHARQAVVITEGPADTWGIGPGGVALLGLRLSSVQLSHLSRFPVRYVAFDSEPTAQRRARKLCDDLAVFDGCTANIVLKTGKDPASAAKWEIEEIRKLLR